MLTIFLQQLAVVLAGTLVLFLPGALIMPLTGLARVVPPYLWPATALGLTLAPLTIATVVTLALGLSIGWLVALELLLAVGCFVLWLVRGKRYAAVRETGLRTSLRTSLGFDRFQWRSVAGLVLGLAFISMLLAWLIGGQVRSDGLYHAAQAFKLLALDDPSFSNTLMFRDGGPHPGYLIPIGQEIIAQTALLSGQDVTAVLLVLPAVLTPAAVLTWAGLGLVLLRSHVAGFMAGAFFLLLQMMVRYAPPPPLPRFQPVVIYPGELALKFMVPLGLAAFMLAVWHDDRLFRRRALLLTLGAIVAILLLHISYVAWLGLGIAGYLLFWAISVRHTRENFRRHLVASVAVALVAVAGLGAFLPILKSMENFANDATAQVKDETEGKDAAKTGRAAGEVSTAYDRFKYQFRGDEQRYHQRPSFLVRGGFLTLLALVCLPIALLFRRHPAAWYVAGTGLLVLVITQTDAIFPHLVNAASPAQATRLHRAFPFIIALTIVALVLAKALGGLWRRPNGGKIAAAVASAVIAGTLLLGNKRFLDIATPDIIALVMKVLLLSAVVLAVWTVISAFTRLRGGDGARQLDTADQARGEDPVSGYTGSVGALRPFSVPPAAGFALVIGIVLVGMTPVLIDVLRQGHARWDERHIPAAQREELRPFNEDIRRELRDLPEGSVVMAEPVASFEILAIAPIYVVGSLPWHVPDTPVNRRVGRYQVVRRFYGPTAEEQRRLEILFNQDVDAVLVSTEDERPASAFVLGKDEIFEKVADGDKYAMYRVDRSSLTDAYCRTSMKAAANKFLDDDAKVSSDAFDNDIVTSTIVLPDECDKISDKTSQENKNA